jgi:type II secretory pathway component PulC
LGLLSNLLLTGAVAGFGFATGQLSLTATLPAPPPFEPPVLAGQSASAMIEEPVLQAVWPPIFGAEAIPEPDPEPEPAPEVAAEPEVRFDYVLTGLIAGTRDERWAFVSSGGPSKLVRVGDTLEGGEVVTEIDSRGVWILWGDIPQVIPAQKSDFSHLVRRVTIADPPPGQPAETLAEVRVRVERLEQRFIERAMSQAGRLVATELADGSAGLDVVWIRQGDLYDQFGLKTGDMILRINGESVEDRDLLASASGVFADGGSVDLEIIRDGTRQVIKVSLDQS